MWLVGSFGTVSLLLLSNLFFAIVTSNYLAYSRNFRSERDTRPARVGCDGRKGLAVSILSRCVGADSFFVPAKGAKAFSGSRQVATVEWFGKMVENECVKCLSARHLD
jgi:hypothetical protein